MGVSPSTLTKTITGKRKCDDHVGRPSLIPPTLENSIEMYCLKMSDSGWGLSRRRLKLVAGQHSVALGIPFKASNTWLDGYLNRHPRLSQRRAQAFDRKRASGLNPDQAKEYFKTLKKSIDYCIEESNNICSLPPNFVLNLDESAVKVQDDGELIIRRGQKSVHKLDYGSFCSTRVTSVNMISAGDFVPTPFCTVVSLGLINY